jgi:hypothetical protein
MKYLKLFMEVMLNIAQSSMTGKILWGMMILNMIQGTVSHQPLKSKTQLQSVVPSVWVCCRIFTN